MAAVITAEEAAADYRQSGLSAREWRRLIGGEEQKKKEKKRDDGEKKKRWTPVGSSLVKMSKRINKSQMSAPSEESVSQKIYQRPPIATGRSVLIG